MNVKRKPVVLTLNKSDLREWLKNKVKQMTGDEIVEKVGEGCCIEETMQTKRKCER